MTTEPTDPFTIVYEYIWELVQDYPPWAEMVRVGNRINLTGNSRNPFKETLKAADLPMVTLMPTESNNNLHSNSSTAAVIQNYTLGIYSGEVRVNVNYFPLKWYTITALACFRQSFLELTWREYQFVKKIEIPTTTDTISEFDAQGNILGWDSVLTISAEMWFPNTLFLPQG